MNYNRLSACTYHIFWLNTKPCGVNTEFDSYLWKDISRQMKIEAQRLVCETMILCSHLSTASHLNFGHIRFHQFPSPTNFCIDPFFLKTPPSHKWRKFGVPLFIGWDYSPYQHFNKKPKMKISVIIQIINLLLKKQIDIDVIQ